MDRGLRVWAASAVLAAACGGGQPVSPPAESDLPRDRFSSRRALGELELLMALRDGAERDRVAAVARTRIRAALEEARIPVDSVATDLPDGAGRFEHLVATLPGKAADRFVLVAPASTAETHPPAAADALSGAAVLVELARVLAHRDFPYTLQFIWLGGEPPRVGAETEGSFEGARSLAEAWAAEGRLAGIRLLVAVNRFCDVDLDIARDLGSHRVHRDQLFAAAGALGRAAAFPLDRPFASLRAPHLAFRDAGLRPIVALEDAGPSAAASEQASPELAAPAACSADSLETAGLVLLEGLDRIGARLAKIDRFARVPQLEPAEPAATQAPQAAEADAPVPDPEPAPAP